MQRIAVFVRINRNRSNPQLRSTAENTSGNFAALSLVGRLSDSFPGSGYFEGERLRRVSFVVDANRELLLLQNSPYLAEADQDRGVYPLVLARDVTGFQLEFWDRRFTRGEWVEKWLLTNQLPQLVRVTLGLGQSVRKGRQPEQLISRVVALPATGGLQ